MTCFSNPKRILSPSNFAAHPSTDWVDCVLSLPAHRRTHVWVRTRARKPGVAVSTARGMTPLTRAQAVDGRARYVGFEPTELMSRGDWYQIRIWGLSDPPAPDDRLILSTDGPLSVRALRRAGTVAQLERHLWGITRADAGTTALEPSVIPVGAAHDLRLHYRATAKLPAGAVLRFVFNGGVFLPKEPYELEILQGKSLLRFQGPEQIGHGKSALGFRLRRDLAPGREVTVALRHDRAVAAPCRLGPAVVGSWYEPLPVFVAEVSVDGGRNFVSPLPENMHSAEYAPGEARTAMLFLPGRRRRGQDLVLRGYYADRFGNPTPAHGTVPVGARLQLLRGTRPVRELGPLSSFRTDPTHVRVPLPRLRPGIWRVQLVAPNGRSVIARSNPMEILADNDARELYWAGLHAHSEDSDAIGELAEVYRRARDDHALDVAACADHTGYFSENTWRRKQETNAAWSQPGAFVVLHAYEYNIGGTYQGRRTRFDINPYSVRPLPRITGHTPLDKALPILTGRRDTVLATHHFGPMVLGLTENARAKRNIRLYEVCSVHGGGLYETGPGAQGLLAAGMRVGFLGGGDSHTGYCTLGPRVVPRAPIAAHHLSSPINARNGVTAVCADRCTAPAVIRAMREQRTYATTGPRILIDLTVSGVRMGQRGRADKARVNARVHACEPIKRIVVMRDGDEVHVVRPRRLDARLRWTDPHAEPGAHTYYIRVEQTDGELAWSSPAWLRIG